MLQFFIHRPVKAGAVSGAPKPTGDIQQRSQRALKDAYQSLELMVEHASQETAHRKDLLPVVVCGEDFFQGGEIGEDLGRCMDIGLAYAFFKRQLVSLSARYPHVLILPGTVYISVGANPGDSHRYAQNDSEDLTASIYVQNVMPVFYGGQWIRLIKKGRHLQYKAPKSSTKIPIKTEADFTARLTQPGKVEVPNYREDTLSDMNEGLIFFGETPLPGEAALLANRACSGDTSEFLSPVFEIGKVGFGVELCGDHMDRKLLEFASAVDVHVISSLGVGWNYSAADKQGYRVQGDSDPKGNAVEVSVGSMTNRIDVKEVGISRFSLHFSALKSLIERAVLFAAKVKGGAFAGLPPRPLRDLQATLSRVEALVPTVREELADRKSCNTLLRDASGIAGRMGSAHPIAIKARQCLGQLTEEGLAVRITVRQSPVLPLPPKLPLAKASS